MPFLGAKTKVKLNIPQLTLAKLAQSGRYQSGSQNVPGAVPARGNFIAELILPLFVMQKILYAIDVFIPHRHGCMPLLLVMKP